MNVLLYRVIGKTRFFINYVISYKSTMIYINR